MKPKQMELNLLMDLKLKNFFNFFEKVELSMKVPVLFEYYLLIVNKF